MEQPTTPESRRATWRDDAVRLVEDMQRWARGEGSDSFPPWRIGYMSGLSEVKRQPDGSFTARTHRREPNKPYGEIVIPDKGRPGAALLDIICWHLDQDVRRYELDPEDPDDTWHRLPSGPLLVDPMFRTAMDDAGMDEMALCRRMVDADGFGTKREISTSMGPKATVSWPILNIRMNEVHAKFDLPGIEGATWSRGHLRIRLDDLPHTVAIAARGRALAEVVDHDMIRRSGNIMVTAITHRADGTYTIATDAARAEGMTAATGKPRAALAA